MESNYKKIMFDKKKEAGGLMTSKQLQDCNIAIHTAAVAAGASGAVPIPVMDAIPISAAQVTMVIALGKIFDQKLTESAAKGIVSAMVSTLVGRSLVKLIPIAGWIASATVAAGVTEAIGWSVAVDLAKKARNLESSVGIELDYAVSKEDIFESMRNDKNVFFYDDIIDVEVINEDDIAGETEESGELYDSDNPDNPDEPDNPDDPDDESIANAFSKAFGEEEE